MIRGIRYFRLNTKDVCTNSFPDNISHILRIAKHLAVNNNYTVIFFGGHIIGIGSFRH